jgi:hypothetical protein
MLPQERGSIDRILAKARLKTITNEGTKTESATAELAAA